MVKYIERNSKWYIIIINHSTDRKRYELSVYPAIENENGFSGFGTILSAGQWQVLNRAERKSKSAQAEAEQLAELFINELIEKCEPLRSFRN